MKVVGGTRTELTICLEGAQEIAVFYNLVELAYQKSPNESLIEHLAKKITYKLREN